MNAGMNWQCKHFDDITSVDMYDILALRTAIFVVEQNCPYQELDGVDKKSFHLWAKHGGEIIACLRIVPAGLSFKETSIGRVAVSINHRNKGIGDQLMKNGMQQIESLFGKVPVRIGAQTYLQKAYKKWGFVQSGEPYIEDGIEHIEMLYNPDL